MTATVPVHPIDRAALDGRADLRIRGATWSNEPEFVLDDLLGHRRWREDGSRFVPIATDSTGSVWCLWVADPAVRAPVVLVESEGRYALVYDELDTALKDASRGLQDHEAHHPDRFKIWMAVHHSGDTEQAVRSRMEARERRGDDLVRWRAQMDRVETALVEGRDGKALELVSSVWANCDREIPRFAALYAEAMLRAGEVPFDVGALEGVEAMSVHWALLLRVHERAGRLAEAEQLRRRIDEEGWYRFRQGFESENVESVQLALDALSPGEHPGWEERLRVQLEVLVLDLARLRARLASADEEGLPEAHARLGLALVEQEPAEAYRHLETAVMELGHENPLTARCFSALEKLPDP